MAMQVGHQGGDEPMLDINTTPLIDVMLVLLIMLIITIPIQTHGVKLDMPGNIPLTKPLLPPVVIRVEISPVGQIFWNGTLIPNHEGLEYSLYQAAKETPQPELHIRPDKKSKYKYTAEVLGAAQRLGVEKLGVIGNDQFID